MLSPWFRDSRPFICRIPASLRVPGALQHRDVSATPSSRIGSHPPAHPSSGRSTPALRLPDGRRNISWGAVKLNMPALKPNTEPEQTEYVVEMHIGVDEDMPGAPWWVFQTGRAKSCHPSGFLISPPACLRGSVCQQASHPTIPLLCLQLREMRSYFPAGVAYRVSHFCVLQACP